MFSYLVGSVCTTYGLAHYIDYLVLSREKEPSLYTRNEMLSGLNKNLKMSDSEVQSLTKGTLFECWGEDKFL